MDLVSICWALYGFNRVFKKLWKGQQVDSIAKELAIHADQCTAALFSAFRTTLPVCRREPITT